MAELPIARSPIEQADPVEIESGWIVSRRSSDAALTITDVSAATKVLVKSERHLYPHGYGTAARQGDWLIVGSGPSEWTLLGPVGAVPAVVQPESMVLDMTHGRALMRLHGELAPRVLEKLCSIDLSEPMCPNLAAFRASVANVVTDIVRDDRAGLRSYLLSCERSSGQYLFDAIRDAGAEFGIDIQGRRPGGRF